MDTNNSSTGDTVVTNQQAAKPPEAVTPPPTTPPAGKARISIGSFSKATHAVLTIAIQSVLTGMTGNPAYPGFNSKLSELTTLRNSYVAAVNAAKDSRMQIAVRNQQRAAVVAMLRDLAHYVQVASGGDLPTLLSSGFTVQRSRKPIGPLPAPADLRLYRGKNSGQIIARCGKLKQAGAYEWRYANAASPATWVEVDSTFAASVTLEGLVPGAQYIVQVRALGTAGPSDWSDAAMLMAV